MEFCDCKPQTCPAGSLLRSVAGRSGQLLNKSSSNTPCSFNLAKERFMAIELNHTIVHSTNREAAARFLVETFDLPAPKSFGPFLVVQTGNGVSLDFMTSPCQS